MNVHSHAPNTLTLRGTHTRASAASLAFSIGLELAVDRPESRSLPEVKRRENRIFSLKDWPSRSESDKESTRAPYPSCEWNYLLGSIGVTWWLGLATLISVIDLRTQCENRVVVVVVEE